MATTDIEARPSSPDDFIKAARQQLESGGEITVRAGGTSLVLPTDAAETLVAELSTNQSMDGDGEAALPSVLTTGQVADLLGVSRPTVVTLVDSGQLPGRRIGTHRRIDRADFIEFRQKRRLDRANALSDLAELSQDLGLYE